MPARNFFPGFHCMLGMINAAVASNEVVHEDLTEVDDDTAAT